MYESDVDYTAVWMKRLAVAPQISRDLPQLSAPPADPPEKPGPGLPACSFLAGPREGLFWLYCMVTFVVQVTVSPDCLGVQVHLPSSDSVRNGWPSTVHKPKLACAKLCRDGDQHEAALSRSSRNHFAFPAHLWLCPWPEGRCGGGNPGSRAKGGWIPGGRGACFQLCGEPARGVELPGWLGLAGLQGEGEERAKGRRRLRLGTRGLCPGEAAAVAGCSGGGSSGGSS